MVTLAVVGRRIRCATCHRFVPVKRADPETENLFLKRLEHIRLMREADQEISESFGHYD